MKHLFFLLILLLCLPLTAQQTYRARVLDGVTGEALPYAQVYIAEGKGTLTDGEGWFTVEAQPTEMLHVSYIGYDRMEVKASDIGKEIRLHPMSTTMQEVTVMPVETILKKMLQRLCHEYESKWSKKGNYFYRLTNDYAGKQEMVEAYISSQNAGCLQNTALLAGRRMKEMTYTARNSNIAFTNLQTLIEASPVVYDQISVRKPSSWNVVCPFHVGVVGWDFTAMSTTTQGKQVTAVFKQEKSGDIDPRTRITCQFSFSPAHYTFTGERLEGTDGKAIYKITITGHMKAPFIDGVVYVDAKKFRLMAFEGTLHNVTLDLERDFRKESAAVTPRIRINYTHDRGYAEVESMVVTMEAGDLKSRSVLMSLGEKKLPFRNKVEVKDNLVEAIDQTRADSSLWNLAYIQRSVAEETLVQRHVVEASEIKDWQYADKDDTYDDAGELRPYLERLSAFGRTIPQEKVYIHMDNTCYFQGDTIWFAAYTRTTSTDTPSNVSGVLYVELLNQDGYLVERKLIEMYKGRGAGFFALNKQIQYSGFYELRAYTRWQLNWGRYERHHSPLASEWFMGGKELERDFFRDYEKLYSRVFPVYDRPLSPGNYERDMTLRAMRRTFKDDPDAPQPTLTLFPEGGNLVAGVPNRIAFEATMSDGQWLKGNLKASPLTPLRGEGNQEEVQVGGFDRGRGVFTIVPERGMEREVTFTTEDGQTVKARLPKPEERGVALQVRQEGDSTHIALHLAGVLPDSLGLTIMHEGKISFFCPIKECTTSFSNQNERAELDIQNSTLPCGVNQVTLFDTEGRIWADRLFFVRKREEMQPTLDISGMKDEYQPYEPITLDVQGRGTRGLVSLTVRDSHQSDALYDNANILTEMLLSSEIRGFVPDPGWYFEADDSLRRAALDLLMMTQGWRRFDWRDMAVRGAWELKEPDEQTPIITGTATRGTDALQEKMRHERISRQAQEALYSMEAQSIIQGRKKEELSKAELERLEQVEAEYMMQNYIADSDIAASSKNDVYRRYGLDRPIKDELSVHAEYVTVKDSGTVKPEVVEAVTHEGSFRIQLPRDFGKAIFFLSLADKKSVDATDGKPYNWVVPVNRNAAFAEYKARIHWPYPRFVKPYDHYQKVFKEPKPLDRQTKDIYDIDTHQMEELAVTAKRGMNRQFTDSQPAFSVDAYEAWNHAEDAGMPVDVMDVKRIARSYLGDFGMEGLTDAASDSMIQIRYGLSPTRRALPQYIGIPADSLYSPKYLTSLPTSFKFSPGEAKDYFGDPAEYENPRGRFDRYVIYTDYCPRLDGSKRYTDNKVETFVAVYPIYDGGRRDVYRDRYYLLDGFARPAEFYSPDYSKQTPPEVPTDYRRTLYWNPRLRLDSEGRARVTLYNNSRTTQIQVEAAGQAADGTLLWNR